MISEKEKKAISTFVNTFGGSYQKLDPLDVDFKIFDDSNKLIAYAEVVIHPRNVRNAYPLSIPVTKISKLLDKRITSVIIWYCDDGIIYGKPRNITGQIMFLSDDLMAVYEKQKGFKYVRH
jgi:hypothetical protein